MIIILSASAESVLKTIARRKLAIIAATRNATNMHATLTDRIAHLASIRGVIVPLPLNAGTYL